MPLMALFLLIMWTAMMIQSLSLFRIPLEKYKRESIISVIFLTSVSLVLQANNLDVITPIVQPIVLAICFLILYRFQWYHAGLIVIITYVIGILLEVISGLVMSGYNLSGAEKIWKNDTIEQWFLIFLQFCFVYIIRKMRIGITFVNPHVKRRIATKLRVRVIIWIMIILCEALSLSLFFDDKHMIYFLLAITLSLIYVLYRFYKREMSEDL